MTAIIEELYQRQDATRHWEPNYSDFESGQRGGWTALVTLALLYAGETYQDERLSKAIAYLQEVDMVGTYAVAIRAHLWAILPPRFEAHLGRDKAWLLEGFSEQAGGWNYGKEPYTTRRDNSITQYGALGLWEIAKRGERIENRYWKLMEDRFIAMQIADGGWNYVGVGGATGSMTAAGLTVLFITQDYLHAEEFVKLDRAQQRNSPHGRAIDLGLGWFEKNFSPSRNPGRETDFYYYLYGVERVGLASGYKYFGERDWYREGAAELIHRICQWDPRNQRMLVNDTVFNDPDAGELATADLAFSLMFLSRGRVPGAINKLSDSTFRWNNRPRDVANLTRFLQSRSEAGLNWQIVSIDASPQDWLDAPLLYIASNEAPPWAPQTKQEADALAAKVASLRAQRAAGEEIAEDETDSGLSAEMRRIRQFIDLGGMIFANAEGRSKAFAEAVERMGRVLYPQYEWRDLPADHPIYALQEGIEGPRPPLRGLSNGVRELIVLSPEIDFSEFYQVASQEHEDHFRLGMNLYLYASEMNAARARLDQHVLERDSTRISAVPVSIVRAAHAGDWDAEAAALDVFSAWAWNERGLDVQVATAPLATIHTIAPAPSLVIASGTRGVELSRDEIAAIETYVNDGGIILFETTGGAGDFTAEAERQIRATLDENPVRALMRHPIVTGDGLPGTTSISRVEYRPYSFTVFGARETAPRLRGMLFENGIDGEGGGDAEPRILFSREDILHGILDQPVWGVAGYKPPYARNLLGNIVQYGHSKR